MNKIFGNVQLISSLKRDASENKLPHAIIFEGNVGCGKKTLAEYICLLLNCKTAPEVCFECNMCRKILTKQSPDVIYTSLPEGKTQIGVDAIRFIRSDVYIKPNDSDYKVYIIDFADKMTVEAQNAFLKVFEEPPEYAVFILLCKSADSLLPTIRSRARIYRTEIFGTDELSNLILSMSEEAQRLSVNNPDSYKLAIMRSNGSIGRALENVTEDVADKNYGSYLFCIEFLKLLKTRASAYMLLCQLNNLEQDREVLLNFFDLFESALSDIMSFKLTEDRLPDFFLTNDELIYYSSALTSTFILESVKIIEDFKSDVLQNGNLQNIITSLSFEFYMLRSRY